MPEQRVIKRLVVLVDGSEQRQDKSEPASPLQTARG